MEPSESKGHMPQRPLILRAGRTTSISKIVGQVQGLSSNARIIKLPPGFVLMDTPTEKCVSAPEYVVTTPGGKATPAPSTESKEGKTQNDLVRITQNQAAPSLSKPTKDNVSPKGTEEETCVVEAENKLPTITPVKEPDKKPKKVIVLTKNSNLGALPPSLCKIVTREDGSKQIVVCQTPVKKKTVIVENNNGSDPNKSSAATTEPNTKPKPKLWWREPIPQFRPKEPIVMYSGCKPENLIPKKKNHKIPESLPCPKKLNDILPQSYTYHVSSYEELKNPDNFKAEIRTTISKKEEALKWLSDFEDISGTNFRITKTFKENSTRIVFKKCFKCCRNTYRKDQVRKRISNRHVGCLARLNITIKNPEMKSSCDMLLAKFPCVIGIYHNHCHSLTHQDSLRYRRPLPEVKQKFADMFKAQITPSMALRVHKLDLRRQYGDKYEEVVHDGAKCPLLPWCYRLYYEICGKKVTEGKKKSTRKSSYIRKKKVVSGELRENSSVVVDFNSRNCISESFSVTSVQGKKEDEVQRSINSLYELNLLPKDSLAIDNEVVNCVEISNSTANPEMILNENEMMVHNKIDDIQSPNHGEDYMEECELLDNSDCQYLDSEPHFSNDVDVPQDKDSTNVDETQDINSSTSPVYSASEEVEDAKEKLRDIFNEIDQRLSSQPNIYLPIVKKFLSNYSPIESATTSDPLAALLNLGSEFSHAQKPTSLKQQVSTIVEGLSDHRKRTLLPSSAEPATQGNSKRKVLVLRMDPNKFHQILGKVEEKNGLKKVVNI